MVTSNLLLHPLPLIHPRMAGMNGMAMDMRRKNSQQIKDGKAMAMLKITIAGEAARGEAAVAAEVVAEVEVAAADQANLENRPRPKAGSHPRVPKVPHQVVAKEDGAMED